MCYKGIKGLQENADRPFKEEQARLETLAQEANRQREMEIDDAIVNKKLLRGMTPNDVLRAWGAPVDRKSEFKGDYRHEFWSYGEPKPVVIGFIDYGDGQGPRLVLNHASRE